MLCIFIYYSKYILEQQRWGKNALTRNNRFNQKRIRKFCKSICFPEYIFSIIPCWAGVSRTLATFKMEFSVTYGNSILDFMGGSRYTSVWAFHLYYVGKSLRKKVCFFWVLNFDIFCFCSYTVQQVSIT